MSHQSESFTSQPYRHRGIALFIFGLPGAGKSTLATALSREYDFIFMSLGRLLNRFVRSGDKDKDVRIAHEAILKGIDAPISLISKLVKRELNGKPFQNIVFDAYPKSYSQFLELRQMLSEISFDDRNIAGIFLETSEELALQRIQNRVVCSACGCSWSKPIAQCPVCGGECESREDDQLNDIVMNRLQRHKHYLSFATYFEKHYRLFRTSAHLDKKVVLSRTREWVEKVIATQDPDF